jgi:preprotein translocase subunit SecF/SecD/SecF fusion protein
MEFDLTTVAALLTVVGFSVNDTVIISDRSART